MQPPGGARLSVKPLPKNLILRVRCRQQLHCHHTVHDGVLGLIYLAEPAPAQQPPQPVVPEPRPGRKPSGVSLSVGSSTTPSPLSQATVKHRQGNSMRCHPLASSRQRVSPPPDTVTLLHETPSPSSDWTVRQPHARGWLG
jgi:hypothetical protein